MQDRHSTKEPHSQDERSLNLLLKANALGFFERHPERSIAGVLQVDGHDSRKEGRKEATNDYIWPLLRAIHRP
jgi:hypothetical protein